MEGRGAEDSVTLIIRAPNQKYHDQTISCFLDWTVEKLKRHISDVYPSRPLSREQRLVYSGRLLQDHQQLRDVLRKQDDYHMLHLVCAPRNPPSDPHRTSEPDFRSTASTDPALSAPASNQDAPNQTGTDDLRHRGGTTARWPDGGSLTAPPAGFPVRSVYTPLQMLWWQRMYAQHYYMQYQAAMAASQAESPSPPSSPRPGVAPVPPAPNPVPEEQQPNPNPQLNLQGGVAQNEDELNRDWLDWLYTVSRVAVLLSVVYFYSSFSRFVMVIGAMLLIYLHQAGWFPFRLEPQDPAPVPAEEPNQDMQEMERIMDDGIEEEEEDADSGDEGSDEAPPPRTSFLSSTWSFISTFFTSLVPEGPARAAR